MEPQDESMLIHVMAREEIFGFSVVLLAPGKSYHLAYYTTTTAHVGELLSRLREEGGHAHVWRNG